MEIANTTEVTTNGNLVSRLLQNCQSLVCLEITKVERQSGVATKSQKYR